MQKRSRKSTGYLIALVSTLSWSTTGVIIAYLNERWAIPAIRIAFWRDFFVALILLVLFLLFWRGRLRVSRERIPYFLIYGFTLAAYNAVWTFSVSLNGAAVSTVLAYGSAGFTVVLARFIFKEWLTLPKIFAVFLSLGGCVLVANAHDPQMWQGGAAAILIGLLSGLLFAVYTLMGKEAARQGIDSWTTLLYTFGIAAGFLFLANQIPAMPGAEPGVLAIIPQVPLAAWLLMVLLSLGPTILGYGLYNLSMHYIPAGIANLICTLEPPLTALEAYVLLGESLSGVQILGSAMVVAAVIVVRIAEDYADRRAASLAAGQGAGSTG